MLAVANALGLLLTLFSGLFALPVLWSLLAGDGTVGAFASVATVTAIVGLILFVVTRSHRREIRPRDGFLLVTLAWVLTSIAAALPLLIVLPGLSFTDAIFESVSGLTTTGSTVLTGLDSLPDSLNLWRHLLHWYGGLGIIVLAVAVLPLLGVGGMQLYRAETPGPMKDEKLTPRITGTAKSLWMTYIGITIVGIAGLKACGMSWLDAVCHSFSTMGLGGFSTHDANVAYFDSAAVEAVLIVLMLVSSLNFAQHFLAVRRATFAPYTGDPEARATLSLMTFSVLGIAALLSWHQIYPTFGTSLRHAAFNVVSMASTTGFVSQNFEEWPMFAPIWMLFLSCLTCSTGSTGGGIKMLRTLVLWQQARRELRMLVHPSSVAPLRVGGRPVSDRITDSVLAFVFLYFVTIVTLTFALLITGLDFSSSFSAVVASINNAGPGLGKVGPATNYQGLTDAQTWVCTAAMLLGRLEILSVAVLFTPTFWRK
jgi:trk system potassium uptake protein